MRHFLLLLVIGFTICFTSCRNDFDFEQSSGDLSFSRDTVYLDTVFTNIGSSTYTLKVYNNSDKDISIPSLRLKRGEASKYRLMVDGMPGKVFNDVELMAKDSMFIFIETTASIADANTDDFLYTDEIEFSSTNGTQQVNLVTLIQDAIFLYPQRDDEGNYESVPVSETNPDRIYGFNLDHADPDHGDEFIFTNTKPYVIYGMATVPTGEVLTVNAGARVHFHAESGLLVRPGARLVVNGSQSVGEELENEVVFEGDRLEPQFADVSGQWLTVWMQAGSSASLTNLTLKNAAVGILMEGNDGTPNSLQLNKVQIYNSGVAGILSRNGHIVGENVAINRAGQASLALTLGGQYNFTHCTIANYSNAYNQVPLLMNDYQETETNINVAPLEAQFTNCIFFGSGNYGISLERIAAEANPPITPLPDFNYTFTNCLIKFFDFSNQFEDEELYQFTGSHYTGSIIAKNSNSTSPKVDFLDTNKNDLRIGDDSAARDLGLTSGVSVDITGKVRNGSAPDAGAYEYAAE